MKKFNTSQFAELVKADKSQNERKEQDSQNPEESRW